MARVYRTYQSETGPDGKRVFLRDARGRKVPHAKYRFEIVQWNGKRKGGTGSTSKRETQRLADRLQAEHDEIRKGYRPPPTQADRARSRPFAEVVADYAAWGAAQGGRRGNPWSPRHARMVASHLAWWQERLGLCSLGDLAGTLPRAEDALRELALSRAPKTVRSYQASLGALCRWCVSRGLLSESPVLAMVPWPSESRAQRRALTPGEVSRLLAAAPPHRRLLYRVALATGLRANELRSLTREHLDPTPSRPGLRLDGAWTKNRRPGFQPMPRELARELVEYAETGDARARYRENPSKGSPGPEALLFVPAGLSHAFGKDLARAGILPDAPGGKATFHSLRHTFVTRLLESGANPAEAQALARHASLALTMGTYAHAQAARLASLAEALGKELAGHPAPEDAPGAAPGEGERGVRWLA